jgi:tRNA(Ile)-lysidine synthase
MTLTDAAALDAVASALAAPPARLGVAVSGGSDSLALLHILHDWASGTGTTLHVVTVNHGLRPEAAAEAEMVRRIAADLGHGHTILNWHWDGTGNLPDRARRARYALMADWAAAGDIPEIALGHTADDLAETLLMRLARGAGVDGLAAMNARRAQGPVTFLRPLLSLRRPGLRALLTRRGVTWADDPSNDDPHYDRTRARAALAALEPLGLTVESLATSARNLARARDTLSAAAAAQVAGMVRSEAGDLVFPADQFAALPAEIRRRALLAAIRWVAGGDYPPRGAAMLRLMDAVAAGQGMALSGCLFTSARGELRIGREPAAVATLATPPGEAWDNRWRLNGPQIKGLSIRAIGEGGLALCPGWRDTGLPRTTLLAAPAVWDADGLVAAPLAGRPEGWSAACLRNVKQYLSCFTAH